MQNVLYAELFFKKEEGTKTATKAKATETTETTKREEEAVVKHYYSINNNITIITM
jgi:hypothetical protein